MKIAMPTRQNQIDEHFGHCEYFTVMSVNRNANQILKEEIVPSPAGCGCKSDIASVLKDQGVSLMLAGNMGDGAVRVLNLSGIRVIRGCGGDVKDVARQWLEGRLQDNGQVCTAHHDHSHDGCHGHGHGHN